MVQFSGVWGPGMKLEGSKTQREEKAKGAKRQREQKPKGAKRQRERKAKGAKGKGQKAKRQKRGLIQDRTGDLQIFSLTLSQLSY